LVQPRNAKEIRPTLEDEVEEFRQDVNAFVTENEILPQNIHVMDEIGLWTGSVAPRIYMNSS
jgi:hypothetical protein